MLETQDHWILRLIYQFSRELNLLIRGEPTVTFWLRQLQREKNPSKCPKLVQDFKEKKRK